jgi:XRE family aerobic/anaerobic benzoate catabolism transcriptional regulator
MRPRPDSQRGPGDVVDTGSSDGNPLRTLALRVRRLRERRGWSRGELAKRAGLSVRFLARVESGEGNISVLRLEALARALETTADALLRSLPPRAGLIALVGLRGAGKSTLGPLLARRLSLPFVEMDRLIVEASGLELDQLFELHGEEYYRRLERETLRRVVQDGRPAVIAAAGGVVNDPETWNALLRHAVVVWLRARPEDHWNRVIAQGDRRPMADSPAAKERLRAILASREGIYAQAALSMDTSSSTPEETAELIECRLLELGST